MAKRFTESDVAAHKRKMAKKPAAAKPKKRLKFGQSPCVVDYIKFPSHVHAMRYQQLKLLQKAGQILWFIREPMFDLGGGTTCRADFLIVWGSGLAYGEKVTVEDVTGFETPSKIRNYKQVKALYGIDVQLVRAPT